MIDKMIRTIRNKVRTPEWKDLEYFHETWKVRIQKMSELISEEETTILDLGCGMMWLKEFLPPEKKYLPCDYTARSADVIVCDFNQGEFPDVPADVAFVSGCLEYIDDPSAFIRKISRNYASLILSYCTLELNPKMKMRKDFGWKNHFTLADLLEIVLAEDFALVKLVNHVDGNVLLKFRKLDEQHKPGSMR